RCCECWLGREHQTDYAGNVRAGHAGTGHSHPEIVRARKSFRRDDLGAGRSDIRFKAPVARWTLTTRDVDETTYLVEIRHRDYALAAGQGAHGRVINICLVGKK